VAAVLAASALAAASSGAPRAPAASPIARRTAAPAPRAAEAELARAIAEDAPLPIAFEELDTAPPSAAPARRSGDERLIEGPMETVLYGAEAGEAAAAALRLLSHKLDLTRDLALGDQVRLLARPGAAGPTLDYVELDGAAGRTRLYRRAPGDGAAAGDFADETGGPLERLLLRTPLAVARITSGFGMRRHPLLGYTRLHRGVDFAAQPGTPVLAAGDGVVEAAGWAGGYGRRVRLRHEDGVETLYAHLQAWAPEAVPGRRVRQGEVIGWTGASGLATGPHLHFEVILAGEPVDPARTRPPAAPLDARQQRAFLARKAALDAALAGAG
jgi:murein DD-endopeptidase MepM/ murein hydrolase activator NlpD